MSKSISRRARHRTVYTYAIFHGNYPYLYGRYAYVGVEDAREAARAKVAALCAKAQIEKSYFTFEVLPLRLVSETKRKAKSHSSGPY